MCKQVTDCVYLSSELERCKKDFVYFYNNYTDAGKKHPIKQDENTRFSCNLDFLVQHRPISVPRNIIKGVAIEQLKQHIHHFLCTTKQSNPCSAH